MKTSNTYSAESDFFGGRFEGSSIKLDTTTEPVPVQLTPEGSNLTMKPSFCHVVIDSALISWKSVSDEFPFRSHDLHWIEFQYNIHWRQEYTVWTICFLSDTVLNLHHNNRRKKYILIFHLLYRIFRCDHSGLFGTFKDSGLSRGNHSGQYKTDHIKLFRNE